MTAVFSHGRLRLYLLKLLAEGPKHGYQLIRLLENRFLGLYAPSAGTIYPRLARMEVEGLVTHTAAGGRKVYEITPSGRSELTARSGELAALESEIQTSVADLSSLAHDIEREVSGSVRDIKRELREATRHARTPPRGSWSSSRWPQPDRGSRSDAGAGVAVGADVAVAADGAGAGAAGAGAAAAGADSGAVELERAVAELAADVRRMARAAGVTEPDVRAATAVVIGALSEVRRLLNAR